MKETWDHRIDRAQKFASEREESNELLTFYASFLRSQKGIYEYLRTRKTWLPSGELARDLTVLRQGASGLFETVEAIGPGVLADEARRLLRASESELDEMLIEYWRTPSDMQFFGKAIVQPYAKWLHEIDAKPLDRKLENGENRCPFCHGKPQVSILQIKETTSESGGRDLLCATCLTAWPFRRVVCANCGEENPSKIGYFHSPEFDHIRIEACDSCQYYIKAVDLTKYGFAIPLVDEVASASLDLWARDHGFTKIEMNLVGV